MTPSPVTIIKTKETQLLFNATGLNMIKEMTSLLFAIERKKWEKLISYNLKAKVLASLIMVKKQDNDFVTAHNPTTEDGLKVTKLLDCIREELGLVVYLIHYLDIHPFLIEIHYLLKLTNQQL